MREPFWWPMTQPPLTAPAFVDLQEYDLWCPEELDTPFPGDEDE